MTPELHRPVSLDRIGPQGLDVTIDATPDECVALARRMNVPAVLNVSCVFHLIREGRDVVVHAPTGAGKTYVFELFLPALKGQAIFTVPTRALANDKLAEWQARGWEVGISTGDVAHKLDARVVVADCRVGAGPGPYRTAQRWGYVPPDYHPPARLPRRCQTKIRPGLRRS